MTKSEWFEKLYAVYPKQRRDRTRAEKSFDKHKSDRYQDLFDRILAWNRYWRDSHTEPQFIPLMSTWLNSKHKDDIPSLQAAIIEQIKKTTLTCVNDNCSAPVTHKGSRCPACMKQYQALAQQQAEDYCQSMGLYLRGETPRSQALENMQQFRRSSPMASRPKIDPRYKRK